VDILVVQLHLLRAQIASHSPVGQRHRFRGPITSESDVDHIPLGLPGSTRVGANSDDIDNMGPAIVVADRDTTLAPSDPRTDTVDSEAEATEHVGEEHILFHAVAASVAGDEFVVNGLGVERDGVGRWRIVEGEVLEGD